MLFCFVYAQLHMYNGIIKYLKLLHYNAIQNFYSGRYIVIK